MAVYTVWAEYYATGEGISYMAIICTAADRKIAAQKFREKFGDFYSRFIVDSVEGVVRNHLTDMLFTDTMLQRCEREKDNCSMSVHAQAYFNFS